MQASGIPPHVMVADEVCQLRKMTERMREEIKEQGLAIRGEMKEQSTALRQELPDVCVEKIVERVRVDGVQPVSQQDIEQLRAVTGAMPAEILAKIEELLERRQRIAREAAAVASASALSSDAVPNETESSPYPVYTWKCKYCL